MKKIIKTRKTKEKYSKASDGGIFKERCSTNDTLPTPC
jgi:hypothetical protein